MDGPQIQHWYDSIHAYLALLRLKEYDKKYSNPSNTYRFARNCNIENPRKLTEKELRDSLRYCKIRRAEVRKSSKGLRKVLLRDCLIDTKANNQIRRARGIKQKIPNGSTVDQFLTSFDDAQSSGQSGGHSMFHQRHFQW